MQDHSDTRSHLSQTTLPHHSSPNQVDTSPPQKPPVSHLNPAVAEFTPSTTFWHQITPAFHYSPHIGIYREMNPPTTFPLHHFEMVNRDIPHGQDMVDVYNHKSFIMTIPLKTLVRFSGIARRTFGRPYWARSPSSTTSWFVEAAGTSSTTSEPSISDQTSTEQSIPPPETHRRQLTLFLYNAENPSNTAIWHTLNWMVNNAHATSKLIPYVPSTLPFPALIDFCQASLVLELLPIPLYISAALIRRVTDRAPTPRMLRDVSWFIPVGDVLIDCTIISIFRHWVEGQYSLRELEAFRDVMSSEGNEGMRWTWEYLFSVANSGRGGKKRIAELEAWVIDLRWVKESNGSKWEDRRQGRGNVPPFLERRDSGVGEIFVGDVKIDDDVGSGDKVVSVQDVSSLGLAGSIGEGDG